MCCCCPAPLSPGFTQTQRVSRLNSECKNDVVSCLVSLHVNQLFKHIPGWCSSKVDNKQFTLQWPYVSILTYGEIHVQYKSFPQFIILN